MKRSRLAFIFGSVVLLVLFSGCATVLSGTSQEITFNSEPAGAQVIVDGEVMGRTPVTVTLRKNKFDNVTVELEGYQTQSRPLSTSYDPIALVNILWDLSTTDLISGAAFEYDPSSYYFNLQPKN
jgi:uncharacterized protein YceK